MNSGVSEEKDVVRFMLRLPASVHDRVTQQAKAYGRSMNSQIVAMLEEVLDDPTISSNEKLLMEAEKILIHRDQARIDAQRYDERLAAIAQELRPTYDEQHKPWENPLMRALFEYHERRDAKRPPDADQPPFKPD